MVLSGCPLVISPLGFVLYLREEHEYISAFGAFGCLTIEI